MIRAISFGLVVGIVQLGLKLLIGLGGEVDIVLVSMASALGYYVGFKDGR